MDRKLKSKLKKQDIGHLSYFTRGKRGYLYHGIWEGIKVIVKINNPNSVAINRMENEALMLKRVNKLGIGPHLFFFDDDYVCYRYVAGMIFDEFLDQCTGDELLSVLKVVLVQMRLLDKEGVTKEEMHKPYKHIVIGKKPVILDFERAHVSIKPKNVTQFVQCITGSRITSVLAKDKIRLDCQRILKEVKKYKNRAKDQYFENIIQLIKPLDSPFCRKVWKQTMQIPLGRITTYSEIARSMRSLGYRAIGRALNKNPFAPSVPCHRVVASDGTIGGFAMGIDKKTRLLETEGIFIENKKIKNFERLLYKFKQ